MPVLLFIVAVDWKMRSTPSKDYTTIRCTIFSKLDDLNYADDQMHLETQMQRKTSYVQSKSGKIAMNIDIKKTEVISPDTKSPRKIQLNGKDIKRTSNFTYLGSLVTPEGVVDKDIVARLG